MEKGHTGKGTSLEERVETRKTSQVRKGMLSLIHSQQKRKLSGGKRRE